MNKGERSNMDNIVLDNLDVEEILESPEEPILTLNFKCNSDLFLRISSAKMKNRN